MTTPPAGPADGRGEDITPFTIDVPEADLADLRERLRRTRWPEPRDGGRLVPGGPAGLRPGAVRLLGASTTTGGGARRGSTRFPQFTTEIDGLGDPLPPRPFPARRTPCPLILTHGWPGSVVEFLKVIGPLTDPAAHGGDAADAFHVVCPSLPGYGFSDKPTRTGWGVERIAARLGRADGAARLRPLRRPGRRLGLGGDDRPRPQRPRARGRHPPQHGDRSSAALTTSAT